MLANPSGTEAWRCRQFADGTPGIPQVNQAFNPLPRGQRNKFNCNLGLSQHDNPYSPIGDQHITRHWGLEHSGIPAAELE